MGASAGCTSAGTAPVVVLCDAAEERGEDWAPMEVANSEGVDGDHIDPWSRMAQEATWSCLAHEEAQLEESFIADSAIGGLVRKDHGGHFVLLEDYYDKAVFGDACKDQCEAQDSPVRKNKECLGPPAPLDPQVIFVTSEQKFVV